MASLYKELEVGEGWQKNKAAENLLQLGDVRGFPIRIDALARGGAIYGENAMIGDDPSDFRRGMDGTVRQFACQDLRVFSQQPLPCDPRATGQELQAQVSAWSSWWSSSGGAFVIPRRVASLDLENIYRVPPVTLGSSIVR